MKKIILITIIALGFLFLHLGCAKNSKKALLIFSYHADYAWVQEEEHGAKDILRNKGIEIKKFYMDTKRHTSREWGEKATNKAMKKIEKFKPDIVIVFDDNACDLVAKKYIGEKLPFVFCGMNGEPEDYGFPAENITGVLERELYAESIELLKQLVPKVKKVAMLFDESNTSKKAISQLKDTDLHVEVSEIFSTNDFNEWKAKVRELQTKVDALGVIAYHTLKDKDGKTSLSMEAVLNWTLENSKIPDFTINDFTVKDGVLCGVVQSGYQQGKAAAEIALRILNGESPADIPIITLQEGITLVNKRRADDLKIHIPEEVSQSATLIYPK